MFTSAVTRTLAARIVILLWVSFGGQHAFAHGFAGSGWMHPIAGIDHMLAMLAVGAWSAQMAGRAIITVPAAFVCAMAAGSLAAQCHFAFPATEAVIALSLFALGIAIALDRRPAMPIAALATALFGLAHGWAHGAEIPHTADTPTYVAGFLTTTAGLHVAGAAGGLLLLERHNGRRWLRSAGIVIAIAGSGLAGIRLQSTWIRRERPRSGKRPFTYLDSRAVVRHLACRFAKPDWQSRFQNFFPSVIPPAGYLWHNDIGCLYVR